jgi:hypothetical protein
MNLGYVIYFRLKTAEVKLEEAIKKTAAEMEQWVLSVLLYLIWFTLTL